MSPNLGPVVSASRLTTCAGVLHEHPFRPRISSAEPLISVVAFLRRHEGFADDDEGVDVPDGEAVTAIMPSVTRSESAGVVGELNWRVGSPPGGSGSSWSIRRRRLDVE